MQAGLATTESAVAASGLNQSHVGLSFGYNQDAGTVIYGRIAGFRITGGGVVIWLDGVPESSPFHALEVAGDAPIYFDAVSGEWETRENVERIRDLLLERHGKR